MFEEIFDFSQMFIIPTICLAVMIIGAAHLFGKDELLQKAEDWIKKESKKILFLLLISFLFLFFASMVFIAVFLGICAGITEKTITHFKGGESEKNYF